jgi:HCOMODA/2-hydroxy-3-carboxy-muconic semialdehyde decarboxylase
VILGSNLPVAVKNSIFLNANARMQAAAIALGGSIKYISVEEARGLAAAPGDLTRAWNYWKRRALERR